MKPSLHRKMRGGSLSEPVGIPGVAEIEVSSPDAM